MFHFPQLVWHTRYLFAIIIVVQPITAAKLQNFPDILRDYKEKDELKELKSGVNDTEKEDSTMDTKRTITLFGFI